MLKWQVTSQESGETRVRLKGDITERARLEGRLEAVYRLGRELVSSGKTVLMLGGEHSLTLGMVKAYREQHESLSVLQLDAHTDLRDSYLGTRFGHATVMPGDVVLGKHCHGTAVAGLIADFLQIRPDHLLEIHGLEKGRRESHHLRRQQKPLILSANVTKFDQRVQAAPRNRRIQAGRFRHFAERHLRLLLGE